MNAPIKHRVKPQMEGNVPVATQTFLQENYVTLEEVENYIFRFEKRYGVSTSDYLKDQTVRSRIPEDDAFKWEAYIDHRRELQRISDETRREYLSGLRDSKSRDNDPAADLLLAA